jgi:hypothetical protein
MDASSAALIRAIFSANDKPLASATDKKPAPRGSVTGGMKVVTQVMQLQVLILSANTQRWYVPDPFAAGGAAAAHAHAQLHALALHPVRISTGPAQLCPALRALRLRLRPAPQ